MKTSASSEKRADMLTEVTSAAKSFLTGKKGRGSIMPGSRKVSTDSKDASPDGRANRTATESISEDSKPRTPSIAMNAEL